MQQQTFRSVHKYAKLSFKEGVLTINIAKNGDSSKSPYNCKDVIINYTSNGIVVTCERDGWEYNERSITYPLGNVSIECVEDEYVDVFLKKGFLKKGLKEVKMVKEGWVKLKPKNEESNSRTIEASQYIIIENL